MFEAYDSPRVAIILPVYNSAKHLEECLTSIESQTYDSFDVFAINDGSTDQSLEILNDFHAKDNRIAVFSQRNQGVSAARNYALEKIEQCNKYAYVAFIDSDDIVSPKFLETHISHVIKNNCEISTCRFSKMTESGQLKRKSLVPLPKTILDKNDFVDLILTSKHWRKTGAGGGMLWKHIYKASLIRGLRFINIKNVAEDEFFNLQVATRANRIVVFPDVLYFYRETASSLSKRRDFIVQTVKGRELCLDLKPKFNQYINLRIFSSFIDSCIKLFKYSIINIHTDVTKYSQEAHLARMKRIMPLKTFLFFSLFCDHKALSKVYLFFRQIFSKKNY